MPIKKFGFKTLCTLLALAVCTFTNAHELQDNRATLVQRDARHVSLQLYVSLPQVMHRVLAPQRPFSEFVMAMAAATPAEFANAALAVKKQVEQELRVVDDKGVAIVLSNWTWPKEPQLQAALRDRAMALTVAPTEHAHDSPLEVRAELRHSQPITTLRVQFPAALKKVMLVYYRPKQVWVEPAQASPLVSF